MLTLTSRALAPEMTPARRVGCDVCFSVRVGRVMNPGRRDYLSLLPTHGALFFPCVEKGNFAVMIKDLKADRLFPIIRVGPA